MSPCWERNWPWWLKEACLHCLTKSLLFVVGQHEEDLSSNHSFLMSCEIASSVRTFKAQRKMSDIDEMFSLFYRVVEKSSNKIVSYSSKWKFKVQSWRLFKISFFFKNCQIETNLFLMWLGLNCELFYAFTTYPTVGENVTAANAINDGTLYL